MNPEEDIRLRQLLEGKRGEPAPSCPAPQEWASLVAGVLPQERCEVMLDHAADCDACGPLLREIADDFRAETTEEEAGIVASLGTATLGGQRELARRMARRPPTAWTGWLAKAAAIVVCAGAGWFAYDHSRAVEPEQVEPEQGVAQGYTELRPFQFRFRGAAYGPVRAERGVGSRMDRPEALVEAEAAIIRELKGQPESTRWLGLRALTEMLDRDPEEAIVTLRRALDQREDDPRLLADLGIAYALRAESANRPADYSSAIEYLSRALKTDPNDASALFNRALVYERIPLYDLAAEDWQQYLEMDSQGGWADEARRGLRDIEEKKKHDKRP